MFGSRVSHFFCQHHNVFGDESILNSALYRNEIKIAIPINCSVIRDLPAQMQGLLRRPDQGKNSSVTRHTHL